MGCSYLCCSTGDGVRLVRAEKEMPDCEEPMRRYKLRRQSGLFVLEFHLFYWWNFWFLPHANADHKGRSHEDSSKADKGAEAERFV